MYYAIDLLEKSTIEYFLASNDQITISEIDDKFENILNSRGLQLYYMIMEQIRKGEVKFIRKYRFTPIRSGVWSKETKTYIPPNQQYVDDKVQYALNTFNNKIIEGVYENKPIRTSIVLMHGKTEEKDWAYTSSGSIYILTEKL